MSGLIRVLKFFIYVCFQLGERMIAQTFDHHRDDGHDENDESANSQLVPHDPFAVIPITNICKIEISIDRNPNQCGKQKLQIQ